MKKVRCDYSAHTSVVVAIPDDAELDDAIEIAENYLATNNVTPSWDLDDGGVDEVDETEYTVNNLEDE